MGAVNTTYTFTPTDVITSSKMNDIIDQTTITTDAIIGTTLDVASGKLKIRSQGITSNELSSDLASMLLPSGAVMPFAMNSAPTGWVAADGASISTGGANAALFAAIGYTYGGSGGSFNLPDLRGIFVRGSGTQSVSGTSYSGTFAAKQNDSIKEHTHGIVQSLNSTTFNPVSGSGVAGFANQTSTLGIDGGGGTETSPANISLLYCIKL